MFPAGYFPKTMFTGGYFPPTTEFTVIDEPASFPYPLLRRRTRR